MANNNIDRDAIGDKKEDVKVQFKQKRYDISGFIGRHPGGSNVLRAVNGRDLDRILAGDEDVLSRVHAHSANAFKMLEKYSLEPKENVDSQMVDLSKPVLQQVGRLRDRYWDWIHEALDHDLRIFDSDFHEGFTRTAWWIIPLIWVPMAGFFARRAFHIFSAEQQLGIVVSAAALSSLFTVGFVAWTVMEYLLHRFVFHWRPSHDSPGQIQFHFLMHGLHHKTPMDRGRLVFPPLPAMFIFGFFYAFYRLILPYPVMCAFGAGKIAGYICYDLTHYYLHHGRPSPQTHYHRLKLYHHAHHYKNWDLGFGISTDFWDKIFKTVGLPA